MEGGEASIQWDSEFLFVYKTREAVLQRMLPTITEDDLNLPSAKKARVVLRKTLSNAEEEQLQLELKMKL